MSRVGSHPGLFDHDPSVRLRRTVPLCAMQVRIFQRALVLRRRLPDDVDLIIDRIMPREYDRDARMDER